MDGESGIRRGITSTLYGNLLTTAVRIFLGVLFLFSGIIKIVDPEGFALVVARYDILPGALVPYAAVLVPALEAAVGFLLVIGYRVRASALIGIALMAAFSVFIGINIARGRRFDCGCFGLERLGLGIGETVGPWVLARDLLFMAGFFLLFRAGRHLLSIENFLEKNRLQNLEKSRYE